MVAVLLLGSEVDQETRRRSLVTLGSRCLYSWFVCGCCYGVVSALDDGGGGYGCPQSCEAPQRERTTETEAAGGVEAGDYPADF